MTTTEPEPWHPGLSAVVAVSLNNVIGLNNDLPWRVSSDLKYFKQLTMGHHLIMGRKTYESIGRPLPGRTTVVLTRQADWRADGVLVAGTWEQLRRMIAADPQPFLVGGATLYGQLLPSCQRLYLTRILTECVGDAFFPWEPADWALESQREPPLGPRDEHPFRLEVFRRLTAPVAPN